MKPYFKSSLIAMSLLTGGAGVMPANAQTATTPPISHHAMFNKINMQQSQADLLGISLADFQARIAQGKTFQQIATDLGITQDQLHQKMLDQMKARLQAMVTSGKITQQQMDQMIQRGSKIPPVGFGQGNRPSGKPSAFGAQNRLQRQADMLGISLADLQARLAQNKTFQQIVTDLGLTPAQMQANILNAQNTHLQELVTSGKITQAQADQMIARMTQHPKPAGAHGAHGPNGFHRPPKA